MENNLIEEISETVFNQTENLNVVSLSHNRLDEMSIAPMAWINHRSEPRAVPTTQHIRHPFCYHKVLFLLKKCSSQMFVVIYINTAPTVSKEQLYL